MTVRFAPVLTVLSTLIFLSMLTSGNLAASELTISAMETDRAINQVLVRKEKRRLYLMADDDVVKSYRISLGENPVGHKFVEGDARTPEGEYTLDWRNSSSSFYKSIHISYPSGEDRELANSGGLNPGGSIMIHGLPNGVDDLAFAYTGLDWTNGCIAVSNDEMDEIWQLVTDGTPIRILP